MNKIKSSLLNSLTTTKSFNDIIKRLSSQGSHSEVLSTYSSMLSVNTPPDTNTFPSIVKACTSLELLSLGLSIHQRVVINGFSSDPYIASSLINFYAKFWYTEIARKLFDRMPEKDIVSCTAIIGCYSRVGDVDKAFCLFNKMRYQGIEPSSVTLLSMLSELSEIKQLLCLHGCSFFYGFMCDIALVNSMLNAYVKCESLEDSRNLFEFMEKRDMISWNSLISGYAQIGDVNETLQLFCHMRSEGFKPDQQTFGAVVSATATQGDLELGKIVHGQIFRAGFDLHLHVKTSLIAMYLKCGIVNVAFRVFESSKDKDVVLWTAMISGLLQNDCADKAVGVFSQMMKSGIKPSSSTITGVLAACAQLGSSDLGTSIHGFLLRRGLKMDIPVQNSLVTMYAKCGHLKQGLAVFTRMENRDLVSWNAIISGYAQNGNLSEALSIFNKMMVTHQRPDSLTIVSLLQACAASGTSHQGKLIHNFVIRTFLRPSILVETSLVDMYCKCGDLHTAQKCFDRILHKDLISWSTIISGYGYHGKADTALRLYSELPQTGRELNHVIFLSILTACSHNGLIEQGLNLFHSMTRQFNIEPKLEHHACLIDLLCRAGRVEEAYEFYKKNFSDPAADVLGILLDACRANKNSKIGDEIAKDVLKLRPADAGNYVQLAHCYASMKRWDGVGEAWMQMRSLGLKKTPAWSLIEISGIITTFFMDHNSHPQFQEIVLVLKCLSREMKKIIHPFEDHEDS
ncbi:pentatricopeptide repeat-containing protein At4g04370 [Carica papaya]|uniref:pentatricopeptide repeat-containing protein At4g04370 n=1 Tax=Carica papaya TaxID=3649 RepID=UPI000B8CF623|nr:pentatricopeptide repeat-containing protein At4g04370 [Carica papaya]